LYVNLLPELDHLGAKSFLLFTSFVEKAKSKLIKMPKKPKGAKWNEPPIEIDDMVYRYDGGGYRRPGSTQVFILSTQGGTARQISDLDKNIRSLVWMGEDKVLFSANLSENSDFEPNNSDIYSMDILNGKIYICEICK
jgi:acylaminoacyl-peptidase